MNYFIKNLLLLTAMLCVVNNNAKSMNNNINTQTYEIKEPNNKNKFELQLTPANDNTNSYTLEEIGTTNPKTKMQYSVYFNEQMQKLLTIFGNATGNLNKLIEKTTDNEINHFKLNNFDLNVKISKELANSLNYNTVNDIKLKQLLPDIQKELNTLWTSIISNEDIKNRKQLAEKARRQADGEFYEGSHGGPTVNCDEGSDWDPQNEYRNSFYNDFCRKTFRNVRNNIKQYIDIFKHLLSINKKYIISDNLIYKCNAVSKLFNSSTNEFIINDNDVNSLQKMCNAFSCRDALTYQINTDINEKVNTFIDTVVNNINNLQKLSSIKEIKEKVINDFKNSCSIIKHNFLLSNDVVDNSMKIINCYNKINECYNKFAQSKFKISNNQEKKTIAPLLLAKCFEECNNAISSILYLRPLNVDLIKFTNNAEKQQFLQAVNNIKLNFDNIEKLHNLFIDLQEPITKRQSAIAQEKLIKHIKVNKDNGMRINNDTVKFLDFSPDTQTVTFQALFQHFIEKFNSLNKYYSTLDLEDQTVLPYLQNNSRSIRNSLNTLYSIINRRYKLFIGDTNNYSPTILGNIFSAVKKIDLAIYYLVNFANDNKCSGLVSNEKWYSHIISETIQSIGKTINNIANDLQDMLDEINEE